MERTMTRSVEFTIYGTPQPQGSKRHVGNGVMIESNRNLKPWRQEAIATAIQAVDGRPAITGPVSVRAVFYFPRPKAHYGTGKHAGEVKTSAPLYCTSGADTDKLQRALGDVLEQSGVLHNDRLIAHWSAWRKYGLPRTTVTIHELTE